VELRGIEPLTSSMPWRILGLLKTVKGLVAGVTVCIVSTE